jgi:hypothetical protein
VFLAASLSRQNSSAPRKQRTTHLAFWLPHLARAHAAKALRSTTFCQFCQYRRRNYKDVLRRRRTGSRHEESRRISVESAGCRGSLSFRFTLTRCCCSRPSPGGDKVLRISLPQWKRSERDDSLAMITRIFLPSKSEFFHGRVVEAERKIVGRIETLIEKLTFISAPFAL